MNNKFSQAQVTRSYIIYICVYTNAYLYIISLQYRVLRDGWTCQYCYVSLMKRMRVYIVRRTRRTELLNSAILSLRLNPIFSAFNASLYTVIHC